ncbi:DUF2840 domain-containing protein [Bradyrhizobium sp. USDA 326]|uniref:DUF2840 domain-containing protein n=1 Tax=Bradyrhizobium sp. USDA 326 TaxID=3377726 RepID=UPI003C736720
MTSSISSSILSAARRRLSPPHRRSVALTHVELTWIVKRIEHWLRFGRHAEEKSIVAAASQVYGSPARSRHPRIRPGRGWRGRVASEQANRLLTR